MSEPTSAAELDGSEQSIEQLRRHVALLQQLGEATNAMSSASTPDEVALVMLTTGLRALGADAGYLALLDPDRQVLRVSRFSGYGSIAVEHLEVPLSANLPIAHAVRMRTSLFIGSNEQLACMQPELQRADPADHACASVPLLVSDDLPPLGAINVSFGTAREFTALDRMLIDTLGERCATSMSRALRYADERRRRIAAEEALLTSRALELNDDIVQLIVAAKLALELSQHELARELLERALTASTRMLSSMTSDTMIFRRDSPALEGVARVDG